MSKKSPKHLQHISRIIPRYRQISPTHSPNCRRRIANTSPTNRTNIVNIEKSWLRPFHLLTSSRNHFLRVSASRLVSQSAPYHKSLFLAQRNSDDRWLKATILFSSVTILFTRPRKGGSPRRKFALKGGSVQKFLNMRLPDM